MRTPFWIAAAVTVPTPGACCVHSVDAGHRSRRLHHFSRTGGTPGDASGLQGTRQGGGSVSHCFR